MGSFETLVSQKSLWEHCILDLNELSMDCLVGNLRKFGHLISSLTIRGSCSRMLYEYLFYSIGSPRCQYSHLEYNDKKHGFFREWEKYFHFVDETLKDFCYSEKNEVILCLKPS